MKNHVDSGQIRENNFVGFTISLVFQEIPFGILPKGSDHKSSERAIVPQIQVSLVHCWSNRENNVSE
jgi:hypothetical protein